MGEIQLWSANVVPEIPANVTQIEDVVPYSNNTNLTTFQQQQIINAFKAGAYDMAAEYVWQKAIVKLKESISELGIEFICELLQRTDKKSYSHLDSILTDYNAIKLAEQLGMISHSAAFEMRQSLETLQFYFSSQAAKENSYLDALRVLSIIKCCVQNILSEPNMDTAIGFSEFRKRLKEENIEANDNQISQLSNSSLFYIRTVCTMLTSSIRTEQGAIMENSINNFKLILPIVWSRLTSDDKRKIGFLYRDIVSDGNFKAANGVKAALSKVNGFDYVPENLRSQTFIEAAQALVDVHFEYDNYYKEPRAIKDVINLGSVIPEPAIMACMKAFLLVYIGNYYGRSLAAVDIAEEQLSRFGIEKWVEFFDSKIPYDQDIIYALCSDSEKPLNNLGLFLRQYKLNMLKLETAQGKKIYSAILNKYINEIKTFKC